MNGLLHGAEPKGDLEKGNAIFGDLFGGAAGAGPNFHISGPHGGMATNALGQPWRGDYIFNSGNLFLDLLPTSSCRTARGRPSRGPTR
ncbi:manganese catalase family protein [Pseudogemmobacter sonorensis]|uniref:manganese catalase family protein n=1 Tax=Pseudogemmobacter sonorensis TaxID=2989681 RepID=UPI003F672200